MSDWVEVTGARVPVEAHDRPGVLIHLLVSPYDVPLAARGRYDGEHKRFFIDLKYMSSEPVEERQEGELTLEVGRRSKRIYSIGVDIDALNASAVGLTVAVRRGVEPGLSRL